MSDKHIDAEAVATAIRAPQGETACPVDWNRCPKCHALVDVPAESFDGTEVRCYGCKLDLVVVELVGGKFILDSRDDDETDAAPQGETSPAPVSAGPDLREAARSLCNYACTKLPDGSPMPPRVYGIPLGEMTPFAQLAVRAVDVEALARALSVAAASGEGPTGPAPDLLAVLGEGET